MKEKAAKNENERGSAGAKMIIFLIVVFLIGHAGFNFVPVAYNGASFKEDMQTAVIQGTALPTGGDPVGMTKLKLRRAAEANSIPPDAIIEVKQVNGGLQARAVYSKKISIIPFGLYSYNYLFDYTATPTGFLAKQ